MVTRQNLATKADTKRIEKKVDDNSADLKTLGQKVADNSKEIKTNRFYLADKLDDRFEEFKGIIIDFKDEILNHIDGAVKELETSRTERTMMGHQIDDHEKRISHLEVTSV